jgi:hypothetical protein
MSFSGGEYLTFMSKTPLQLKDPFFHFPLPSMLYLL